MVRGVVVGMEYKISIDNPSGSLLCKDDIVRVVKATSIGASGFESLVVQTRGGIRWRIDNGQIDYYLPTNKGVN